MVVFLGGKSHLNWMMTGGTPMAKRKPPFFNVGILKIPMGIYPTNLPISSTFLFWKQLRIYFEHQSSVRKSSQLRNRKQLVTDGIDSLSLFLALPSIGVAYWCWPKVKQTTRYISIHYPVQVKDCSSRVQTSFGRSSGFSHIFVCLRS